MNPLDISKLVSFDYLGKLRLLPSAIADECDKLNANSDAFVESTLLTIDVGKFNICIKDCAEFYNTKIKLIEQEKQKSIKLRICIENEDLRYQKELNKINDAIREHQLQYDRYMYINISIISEIDSYKRVEMEQAIVIDSLTNK